MAAVSLDIYPRLRKLAGNGRAILLFYWPWGSA